MPRRSKIPEIGVRRLNPICGFAPQAEPGGSLGESAMKREIFAWSFGLCVFVFAARALNAQSVTCAEHEVMIRHLSQHFGEVRQMVGLSTGGQLVELFGAEDTGTWSVVITAPTGRACLLVAGGYFERAAPAVSVPQGAPM